MDADIFDRYKREDQRQCTSWNPAVERREKVFVRNIVFRVYIAWREAVRQIISDSIVASITACHAVDLGSIPSQRVNFLPFFFLFMCCKILLSLKDFFFNTRMIVKRKEAKERSPSLFLSFWPSPQPTMSCSPPPESTS